MKTFNDITFKAHPFYQDGLVSRTYFDNGYGVSVVKHDKSYGGNEGLYELAVLLGEELHYDNSVANGDVVGWLKPDEVTDLMMTIQSWEYNIHIDKQIV